MDKVQGKQVNPDFQDQTVYAKVKHFRIKHPSAPGMTLTHTCLEGPENAVYARGYSDGGSLIAFPTYWADLVDKSTISIQLTPTGSAQSLYVEHVYGDGFTVGGACEPYFFWTAIGVRTDVPALVVESKQEETANEAVSFWRTLLHELGF